MLEVISYLEGRLEDAKRYVAAYEKVGREDGEYYKTIVFFLEEELKRLQGEEDE